MSSKRVLKAIGFGAVIALHGGVLFAADDANPVVNEPVQERSVRAELVQELRLPGVADQLRRPSALFADHRAGEILVGDESRGRIAIFDSHGVFRADFYGQDRFSSPRDIVVDSEGFIFVLAGTREGQRVLRYDFDGSYLGLLEVGPSLDSKPFVPAAMAIDETDAIYLRDTEEPRLGVWDRDGSLLRVIDLAPELDAKTRNELIVGAVEIAGGELYAVLTSFGVVHVYDLEGKFLRVIGRQGSTPGHLAFPVDVAVTSEGRVLVLDQNRFNVVCYGSDGTFRGEFGGKGISLGWFYRPSLLAVDDNDQVYIGQIYMGRLQICRLPAFMAGREPKVGGWSRAEAFRETSGKESDPRDEPHAEWTAGIAQYTLNSITSVNRRLDACLNS